MLSEAGRGCEIHEGTPIAADRTLEFLFLKIAKLEDQEIDSFL
jgi:hypothetical protein